MVNSIEIINTRIEWVINNDKISNTEKDIRLLELRAIRSLINAS